MASGGLVIGSSSALSGREAADSGSSSLRLAIDGSQSVTVEGGHGQEQTKHIVLDVEVTPKAAAMIDFVVDAQDEYDGVKMPRSKSSCSKSTRVSREDLAAGMNQIRMMRNVVLLGLAVIIVLLAGIIFAAMFAIWMAAEYHVKDTQLIDTEGRGVATIEKLGAIAGVSFARNSRRLLNDANVSLDGDNFNLENLEMPYQEFASSQASYKQGQTDWVVGLPDATVRAVRISSVDAGVAYGTTSSWWGSILWQASCPTQSDGSICQITWKGGPDFSYEAFELSQTSLVTQDTSQNSSETPSATTTRLAVETTPTTQNGSSVESPNETANAFKTTTSSSTMTTTTMPGMSRLLAARAGRSLDSTAPSESLDRSLGSTKSSM